MDGLRQKWLDDVWPAVYKLRWFAAVWIVVALVAIPWGVRAQERGLEDAAREALSEAGIAVDDVAFTGRNAVVVAALSPTEQRRAATVLSEVSGVRDVEWSIVEPAPEPVPVTTTTTTAAPSADQPATMTLKVVAGRISVRGTLPDAATAAAVGVNAERLYGPGISNGLLVDDVDPVAWSSAAAEIVATLPIVSDVEVTLDGDGVAIVAVAPTEEADRTFRAEVRRVLGPDVTVDFDVTVDGGELPELAILDAGDGSVTISGTVPKRKLRDEIAAAVTAVSDGADVVDGLAVGKSLADAYVVERVPLLVARLGGAETWSLRYDGEHLAGAIAGDGVFRGAKPEPSARLEALLDELAVVLLGNPDLVITLEVGSPQGDDADAAADLSNRRGFNALIELVRAGVDPDRVSVTVADGDEEVLRFRIEPAER